MSFAIRRWLWTLIGLCAVVGLTAQGAWELRKDRDGIRVYVRKPENSKFLELRIRTKIQTSIETLMAVLDDVDAHQDWVFRCPNTEMVRRVDTDRFYYYAYSDFPFPAKDRDAVIYYEKYRDPKTGIVHTKSSAAPNERPEVKDVIRIRRFESTYTIKPLSDGYLDIDYFLSTDPGGQIPAWMVNMGIVKGPYRTMKGLFDQVKLEKYEAPNSKGVVE